MAALLDHPRDIAAQVLGVEGAGAVWLGPGDDVGLQQVQAGGRGGRQEGAREYAGPSEGTGNLDLTHREGGKEALYFG